MTSLATISRSFILTCLVLTGCGQSTPEPPEPPQLYPPRFYTESWQDQPGTRDPGLYIAIVRDVQTNNRYVVVQGVQGIAITPLIER